MATNKTDNDSDDHTENWLTLAEHVQIKVTRRASDISYLQAKAGFLIAANVIVLQVASTLPRFTDSLAIFGVAAVVSLVIASLVLSIISVLISKAATPLNIDDVILTMNKRRMTREVFSKWLIDSYNAANKGFNKVYSRKYYQQLAAAITLVLAIIVIIILKGFDLYV